MILNAIIKLINDYESKVDDLNDIINRFNLSQNHIRALQNQLQKIIKQKNEFSLILAYLNNHRNNSNQSAVESISESTSESASESESSLDSVDYDLFRFASAESFDSIEFTFFKSFKISDPLVFENNKTNSWNSWMTNMRNKLEANEDWYSIEMIKKTYV